MDTPRGADAARDLLAFIDAAPSPFHACATAAARLEGAGFREVRETDAWAAGPGRRYLLRGGSLVAWVAGDGPPDTPFRVVGAHTDSPNLRVKPNADAGHLGYRQVAVEVYGGALLNSWLDRDLGLSGRLVVRGAGGAPEERLLRIDRPLLRVPQLAIHLDREIGERGLKLNPQQHLSPVWGLGDPTPGAFTELVAAAAGVAAGDVLAWDLMAHDLAPGTLAGAADELVSAPRLDNLCSAWAGLVALLAAAEGAGGGGLPVLVLFDHEEIGSTSERGAASTLLPTVLERIVAGAGGGREDLFRALAGSLCASADMAHATHPNYADRHEPGHRIHLNAGPVLKVNSNLRYATDGATGAAFVLACEQAGVPFQRYAHRSDLPCGSTIGPITAAGAGIPTFDVGAPQLAMHSARELAGAEDPAHYAAALAAFLAPAG
jgi:aspartyl aminopeptidase